MGGKKVKGAPKGKARYEVGEDVGLARFTRRIDGRTWKDPKTDQIIQKENALNSGTGPHGKGKYWKLIEILKANA